MNQSCDKNPKRNGPVDGGLSRSYMVLGYESGQGRNPCSPGQQDYCNRRQDCFHAMLYYAAQMVDSHC